MRSKAVLFASLALSAVASAFAIGYLIGIARAPAIDRPNSQAIASAEAASPFNKMQGFPALVAPETNMKGVRDRGYAFCYQPQLKRVNRTCADEQDGAIHELSITLVMARPDIARMQSSEKERWVGAHPQLTTAANAYCWKIYREAGARDARILSACLSNLGDSSRVVPLQYLAPN